MTCDKDMRDLLEAVENVSRDVVESLVESKNTIPIKRDPERAIHEAQLRFERLHGIS